MPQDYGYFTRQDINFDFTSGSGRTSSFPKNSLYISGYDLKIRSFSPLYNGKFEVEQCPPQEMTHIKQVHTQRPDLVARVELSSQLAQTVLSHHHKISRAKKIIVETTPQLERSAQDLFMSFLE